VESIRSQLIAQVVGLFDSPDDALSAAVEAVFEVCGKKWATHCGAFCSASEKGICRPNFSACGTSVHFVRVTDHVVTA
jgi:hypothetical protein